MKNVFLPLILISLIAIPTLGYANTHNKPEAFSRKVIGSVNDWLSRLVIGSVNDGKDGVEKGDARQLYRLGLIYAEAHGFPKYSKEGIRLIQKYAEKGYAPAQFDLAHVYAEGRDVPQDLVTALMWSNLFMSQREPYGMGFQETIVAKMTPVQIVKAQKLTREWTRKHGLRAINRGIDFKRALETYLAPNKNTHIGVMTLKRSFPGCHFNNINNIKNPEKVYTQYSLVFQGKCLLINKGVPIASQSINDDGDAVVTITTDGDRAGIASTTFSTGSNNSLFDVIFNQTGWETDLVRCDVVWSATFWTRIYSLKIPNAKPVFAIVTYNHGSHAKSGELTIYLGQDLPDVGSKETFRGYYPNINWTDCDTSQGENPDTSQEEKAENDKPNSTRTVLGDNQEHTEACPTGMIEDMSIARCVPDTSQGETPAEAQYELGLKYARGQGVTQDYKEAVRLLKKAAEQGVADAQTFLGNMYFIGHGVTKDYVVAHFWFSIGEANGDKLAKEVRKIVEKRMTATDISRAQKLSNEWMLKH